MSPSVRRLVDLFSRAIDALIERQAQQMARAARASALLRFPEKPAAPRKRQSTGGPAATVRRRRRRRHRRDPQPAAEATTPAADPQLVRPSIERETGTPIDLRERGGNPAAGDRCPAPAAGGADDAGRLTDPDPVDKPAPESGTGVGRLDEPLPHDDGARVEVLEELSGAPPAPDDAAAPPAEPDPAGGQVAAGGAVAEDLKEPAAHLTPAPAHEDILPLLPASIGTEKEEQPAPPPPPPPRRTVTCKVCGEPGHNARRHRDRGAPICSQSCPSTVQCQGQVPESETESVQDVIPNSAHEARGWERADPDQDFTDLAPAGEEPARAPVPELVPPAPDVPLARIAPRPPGGPRGMTPKLPINRLTRDEVRARIAYPDDILRPLTRGDCEVDTVRPCPWVSCKWHLALDVNPDTGAIKMNFPHLEVWEMAQTCALDVADRGGITLEETGATINVTRERIRQMERDVIVHVARLRRIGRLEIEEVPDRGHSPLGAAMGE